jgi:excisionase family DNA binding protein
MSSRPGGEGVGQYPPLVDRGRADGLNLKQVAATLGVHYMTAYRYVRTGRLPARRLGTGWVVDRGEVVAFSARASQTESFASALPSPTEDGPVAFWRSRLRRALSVGDETAAWRILEQALAAGHSSADCYLDVLMGAIDDLSGRSRRPDGPVAEEYLAMATAARLVARLGARFRRPGRSRGTVVFGAPLGEHHTLPVSVVADLVRIEGFSCLELGADVPPEAFAGAARGAHRLVAVGIGVTTASNLDAVRDTVRAIRAVDAAIPIVIGGQAASGALRERIGADAWAADGRQAVEIIGDLTRSRRKYWVVGDTDDFASDMATGG